MQSHLELKIIDATLPDVDFSYSRSVKRIDKQSSGHESSPFLI
jgi:hypothetical protein